MACLPKEVFFLHGQVEWWGGGGDFECLGCKLNDFVLELRVVFGLKKESMCAKLMCFYTQLEASNSYVEKEQPLSFSLKNKRYVFFLEHARKHVPYVLDE